MCIKNDRNKSDYARLSSPYWSGMQQGTNGYPRKHQSGQYYIWDGYDEYFDAIAIEFYGVKIQNWL